MNPGLIAAALVAGGTALWMTIADRQMRDVVDASLRLRRTMQTDPARTLTRLCARSGNARTMIGEVRMPPLTGASLLTCVASVHHRPGRPRERGAPPPSWPPASCAKPHGGYLEPVRFRQIRVCCSQGQAPCLFEWRFFMKS